ncbi:MAG: polysaccharide biosynthesis/export family protein [Planctomycetota bacterium]
MLHQTSILQSFTAHAREGTRARLVPERSPRPGAHCAPLALRALVLALLAGGAAACAGPSVNPDLFALNTRSLQDFYQREYLICAGDQLEVYIDPDLMASATEFFSTFKALVRPDGRISIPPFGEFQAAGRTPREVAADIAAHCPEIGVGKAPGSEDAARVTVQVTETEDWFVYVEGEVRQSGPVEFRAHFTLSQAIGAAGGIHYLGDDGDVFVVREGLGSRQAAGVEVDLHEVWAGETLDLHLLPGDVVHVKPTSITKVNRFFEQYIWGFLPFNVGGRSVYYGGP